MGQLKGLAGIKAKAIDAAFIEKPGDIRKILREGKGATTAGDNGAINVWKDDEGKIRCVAQRYMVTLDTQIFKTLAEAEGWTKKWMKEIQ